MCHRDTEGQHWAPKAAFDVIRLLLQVRAVCTNMAMARSWMNMTPHANAPSSLNQIVAAAAAAAGDHCSYRLHGTACSWALQESWELIRSWFTWPLCTTVVGKEPWVMTTVRHLHRCTMS